MALAPRLGVSVGVGVMNGVDVGTTEEVGVKTVGRSGVQVGEGAGDDPAGARISRIAPVQ